MYHANNRRIWRNLRDRFPHPYTIDDAQKWIEFAAAEVPQLNFAVIVNEEAVGGIGLIVGDDIYFRTAEIGYWISEEHWGKGIASEAIKAVVEHGFDRFKLLRIWAEVFEWNPVSMHVLEKTGFVKEGTLHKAAIKDGVVIDTVRYAVVR